MATSSTVMTTQQLLEAERRTKLSTPESVLMDRAAEAVAAEGRRASEARTRSLERAKIVLLVGTGNNGGDALLAGAQLSRDGAQVTAVLVGSSAHERGLAAFTGAGGLVVSAAEALTDAVGHVQDAHCVIDGIVGLGGRPGLRPPALELVAAIGKDSAVIAIDLPSGLEADSDLADSPRVRADVTVTFTALKRCLATSPAKAWAGLVVLADVGVEIE